MNIYPQFCFHIGLFTRWQKLYTLPVSLWFASFNANIICSISYQWGPQKCKTNQNTNYQNYKIGEVKGEQIGGFEQCGNKLMEQINMESIEKHKKKVPIWRLCFMVSQGRNVNPGQIQEKMVWSIQGTLLLTQ